MTALATIFALTPMALGVTGGGGFISQPLAIVVVGGLVSSTALTLILVPVLYRLVEGGSERRRLLKSLRKPSAAAPHRPQAPAAAVVSRAAAAPAVQTAAAGHDGHAVYDSGSSASQDWTTGAIPKVRGRRAANEPRPAPGTPGARSPGARTRVGVRPRPWAPTREGSLSAA